MQGYKTYIVAAVTVIWALYGMLSGNLDIAAGTQLIASSGLAAAIRHGIANS
jgi:hypothetical protein